MIKSSVLVCVATIFLSSCSACYAKPVPKPATTSLVKVYTPDWFHCTACDLLKGVLKARGHYIHTVRNSTVCGIAEFPTCVYSNGTTDSGKLINERRITIPNTVVFYEVSP